jgi:membrane-associated phospholipid phosphatase
MSEGAVPLSWQRQLAGRLRRFTLLKIVGTTAFISLFFVGYFQVLRNAAYPVSTMPVTALDQLIGFQPAALPAYLSLWFYVGIPPALLHGLRELLAYGCWIAALCLAGLGIFYLWPTAVPALAVDTALHPGFRLLQGVDAAGNACPSMHVATATFSALWLDRLLREVGAGHGSRALNGAWFALIAYSTLAVKQHVAIDVLAGLLLGAAFAWPSLAARRRGEPAIIRSEEPSPRSRG